MSGTYSFPMFPLDRISSYEYYDTPDGYDVHLKMYYCFKQAIRWGGFFIVGDIMGVSKPVGWVATLDRFWHLFKPLAAVSLAYPLVANVSCLLRKKDDPWNHVLAGAVFCGLFGKFTNAHAGSVLLLPVTIGCGLLKYANLVEGYENYPDYLYEMNAKSYYSQNLNAYKNDYSMFDQRPKGWVTLQDYEKA